MKSIKRRLFAVLIVVLSLIAIAKYSSASTLLPWVRFGGIYRTTAGIGTGSLTINATVKEIDYENGDVWKANVPGMETIYGAKIVLSGATRTGGYSFNGDPANPDDVTFSIVSSDGYVYFTSILTDSVLTRQSSYFVWLNQWLNANNPATLNLHSVILRPNGDDGVHPSRYITELAAYLSSANVSGLKMQLFTPSSGDFTTNSSGTISFGLLDGLKSLVVPQPTITTDSGISTNGNSATLNATVNPNGIDAAVYFECGTGTSYNISTNPQSIGNGTSNVNVTANITNLLPNTGYRCRVVVINPYGTFYGNDVNFTTPPITLTIISPVTGGTIYRPDILVRGTVANTTGNETGVTINGTVATVYGNQFVLNHLPLNEGPNTITAASTDTTGNTATVSITVNAVISTPYITLNANITSGVAPLTTYFSVSTSMPNAVSTYQMDFEGNGIIDYTGTTFDNISFAYDTEGIYFPTITVIDEQNNTYTDTIAITVLNQTDIDALLKGKWNAMKTALANRDVEGAAGYFIDRSKERYRTIFEALRDQLPVISGTFVEFSIVEVYDNTAEYEVVANENGVLYSYPGVFIKDGNGIWKFKDF